MQSFVFRSLIALLTLAACSKASTPDLAPPAEPVASAEPKPEVSPELPAPNLAKLQSDVARTLPELKAMSAAAHKKNRTPTDGTGLCMGPFSRDLDRTIELAKTVTELRFREGWPDAQEGVASAFDMVLVEMRSCINCVPEDVKDCDKTDKAIAKLQTLLPEAKRVTVSPAGRATAVAPGPAAAANVARLRECCGQLRTQARPILRSPEGAQLLQAAAQCDVLASQAGPSGAAPEVGVLRSALAGQNIPPVCAGF